ncbi:MAG: hypothetical protein HY690_13090 [Chloroflexi bacterium]|nr:hypothetical protein [Chloroflexota bacterium]
MTGQRWPGSRARLLADGQRHQVEQGGADERGRILTRRAPGGVDHHDRAGPQPGGRVDSRAGLADDGAGGAAAGEALDLGLDRVHDLDLEPPIEAVEVAGPPGPDHRIADALQHAAAEGRVDEHGRDLQDGVLASTSFRGLDTEGLIGLVQGEQREAEGVLHAGSPEAVELAAEDGQGVGHRLVALAEQHRVQQVEAEGALALGHVEVHDVAVATRRDQAERGAGQVAVGIDQHERRALPVDGSCFHEVTGEPQQQRRLAAAGLGHQQQVAAEQLLGQRHQDRASLMGRDADPTATRDRGGQGQPLPGGGALEQRYVGLSLGQVPEAGQFAGVEHRHRSSRRQGRRRAQVLGAPVEPARQQAVARGQVELAVGRGELRQTRLDSPAAAPRPARTRPAEAGSGRRRG